MRGHQLARQWRLVQHLAHSRIGLGPEEIADRLHCTRRTVYRDIDALQAAGFPVTRKTRDGRVFYGLVEGFELGDIPFTADELLALVFSENLLKAPSDAFFQDSLCSAMDKVRARLGPELGDFLGRLREAFHAVPGPHKNYREFEGVIRVLNQAVAVRRRVQLEYRSARSGHGGRPSRRSFDPYQVWYQNGGLYVIGHDHQGHELRTFAIERIHSVKPREEHFPEPKDFDFEKHQASAFGVVAEAPLPVRLRFSGRRAFYIKDRTWHHSQRLKDEAGGALLLEMEVGASDELKQWILSFGADVEVLQPESLRDQLRDELDVARLLYGQAGARH